MASQYSIISKEYFVSNYRDGLDMENHIFIDVKTYQQVADQLQASIAFKAESILDAISIHQGSGRLVRGKRLNISVPNMFYDDFISNTLLQLFK